MIQRDIFRLLNHNRSQQRKKNLSLNDRSHSYGSSPQKDSLKHFQNEITQLLRRQKQRNKNNKGKESDKKRIKSIQIQQQKQQLKTELDAFKQKYDMIKRQSHMTKQLEKVSRTFESSLRQIRQHQKQQKNRKSMQYPLQMHNQFMQPNPYYTSQQQTYIGDINNIRYCSVPGLYDNYSYPNPQNKRKRQYNRFQTKRQVKRRLRKCMLAVFFIVSFQKLVSKIIAKRRLIFQYYWPQKYKSFIQFLRNQLYKKNKKFFSQILAKQQVQLTINQDDSKKLKLQKINTHKELMQCLLKEINQAFNSPEIRKKSNQIIYVFCKHGAFIQNGVLTPQQAQIVCFSAENKYLRLDSSLQQIQIIHFLFIKVILFNMILQPWKVNLNGFNNTKLVLMRNFHFFGSILYWLLMRIEDQLLEKPRPQHYLVGNWDEADKNMKCSLSLVYPKKKIQEGQLISGLFNRQKIDELFYGIDFSKEEQQIKQTITSIHTSIKQYHKSLIETVKLQKKRVNLKYKQI